MLTLYSQVLVNVNVPTLVYRKEEGFKVTWFALFKLFPVSVISTKTCKNITIDLVVSKIYE